MTGLEDHPFFSPHGHHPHPHAHGRGRGGRGHHHGPPPFWGWDRHGGPQQWGWQNQPQNDNADAPEASRSANQTSESTPGPSTQAENRSGEKETGSPSESESDNDKHCQGRCGKGKHRKGRGGPPHGLGRGGCGGKGRHGPPGAGPFDGFPRGRGPHHRGRHGRGWHQGPPGANFDFLRNLAAQFGIPFDTPQNDVDFVPSVDVFDTPAKYILHVSLPGAKKDDLSIDYDAGESVLRLAGVVYRPGINEDLHQALAMEERTREVGVFEREIRLGTREAPAVVSIDEITAKLEEGVLIVTLPKIEAEPEPKKKVIVEDGDTEKEKDAMHVDEASVTMTPEGSDSEEENREYVQVPVQ